MTAITKQRSNNTGLSLARETSPSVVDVNTVWNTQEPNSYKNFGAQYKSVTRAPINSGRQNKKGVTVDLDVSGGWQEDLTYEALQNKIEGLFYAAFRRKSETAVTAADTTDDSYTVASSAGFAVGDLIRASGFANAQNNGLHNVSSVAGGKIDSVENLATEASVVGGTIVKIGHVAASGDITYNAANKTLGSTALDFSTLGLIVGEWLYCSADLVADSLTANLGMARIKTIAPNAIVFDKVTPAVPTLPIVDASGVGVTAHLYFGRVIKNELGTAIQHYTYQAERTLGLDDTTAVNVQAEYLTGNIINEGVFTFNTADKVTIDWTLLGARYETRTSAIGPKVGVRPFLAETSAFNTSTDVRWSAIELVGQDTPLYAFVMDLSITINNSAKADKALGVLGAIDITEGNFKVSAAVTAYFANVTASQAIENNSDVTLACCIARDNHGIVFDLPLISLSDGRPNIAANEAIQLPLDIDAATAASLNPASDYTMMIVFFDYLPSVATP